MKKSANEKRIYKSEVSIIYIWGIKWVGNNIHKKNIHYFISTEQIEKVELERLFDKSMLKTVKQIEFFNCHRTSFSGFEPIGVFLMNKIVDLNRNARNYFKDYQQCFTVISVMTSKNRIAYILIKWLNFLWN